MTSHWPRGRILIQFLTLFTALLLAAIVIYVDTIMLGNTMGETSLVQILQAFLILGSAALFGAGASLSIDQRGYLILVSTLFLCMFVREQDGLLDNIVHGFWRVPVLIIATVGLIGVMRNRNTVRVPFLQHAQDSSFWILAVGFLQLVVFSRLFGTGHLWHNIPGQGDLGPTRMIVQEGVELVSYALIFLGSLLSHKFQFAKRSNPTKALD